MNKLLLSLLFFSAMANAQIVNIPDANFKAKLIALGIDTNSDGEIQNTEAEATTSLYVSESQISDLSGIEAFTNLTALDCSHNQITSLNLGLNTMLTGLDCSFNLLTTLDVTNCPNLTGLNCGFNQITEIINVNMLTGLEMLSCSENQISSLDTSLMPGLIMLICNDNQLSSIDVSGNSELQWLYCGLNSLTSIDISTLSELLFFDCSYNQLTSIDLSANPLVQEVKTSGNLLATLDISMLPSLQKLECTENSLSAIDVSNNPQLVLLKCTSNPITNLDLSQNTALVELECVNTALTTLDLNNLTQLETLNYSNNALPSVDLSNNLNLKSLWMQGTGTETIDLSTLVNLTYFNFTQNPIEVIDVSNQHLLQTIIGGSSSLTSVYMKNGINETFIFFNNCPNLTMVCGDDTQLASIEDALEVTAVTSALVTSYCSFTPGGDYNTITGTIQFDANNNGCEISDTYQPNIKMTINDGSNSGASFTTTSGNYSFYTAEGTFTVAPDVENPSFFVFSPATFETTFADINNNIATNDICITPNGIHPDVEIVIAPITGARPGFDALYEIVYKNKGNQILTGNLTFSYDDTILDLVSSSAVPNEENIGQLQWSYTNLLPFESRSITITLNVNSPLETPAVNMGDILDYSVTINPISGDESPADNQFTFHHTVVNSFDPNDITCLEGGSVSPDVIGQYLHYITNFENLGTAAAENVVVRIAVDTQQYDINSLQVLNSSTDINTRITDSTVEFIFENINLAPAQGDPPVGGHGNVLFKIRSKSNLVSGDIVSNRADIFFDYNFPVETNAAETIFQSLKNPDFVTDNTLTIYPNPTSSIIYIKGDFAIKSVELFDIQGRLLQLASESSTTAAIDLSTRAKGMYFLRISTERGTIVEKVVRK